MTSLHASSSIASPCVLIPINGSRDILLQGELTPHELSTANAHLQGESVRWVPASVYELDFHPDFAADLLELAIQIESLPSLSLEDAASVLFA